jgi:hypothetical protein
MLIINEKKFKYFYCKHIKVDKTGSKKELLRQKKRLKKNGFG